MNILAAGLMLVLATQQRLPSTLQVAQLEDPRGRAAAVVVGAGQEGPVITNRQLPATQLEQTQQVQAPGTRFRVEFAEADLRAVLSALAQYHGLNLVMPPTITGTVTVDLNNVTLQEALDAILTPRNMQYRIEGNLLRVDLLQMENRTFSFDYITTQRSLSRSVNASSTAGGGSSVGAGAGASGTGGFGGGGGGSSTSISGTEATNLLTDVETGLTSLKSATGKFVFNKMAGLIFATDFPKNLDAIGLYLETIESAVHRQVVIEAKVIEVKLNEDSQTGVNWSAVLGNALRIEQNLGIQGTIQATATFKDFNAVLSALRNQGTVDVLSSPTVATLNNQPAVIRVGTQDIFFTTTTQVDPRTGTIVQTAVTPSAINEGIVLDVTPQISDDNIITMNIHPTITERTGQATSPRGDSVPIVDVRETDVVVRVAEGETVMIGGLISSRKIETTNKIPVLGDVPFVGGLFRRSATENRKTDLVILLTPRVLNVRTAVDYARERMEQQDKLRVEKP
jgi:MSHA biogenesis protein MshL